MDWISPRVCRLAGMPGCIAIVLTLSPGVASGQPPEPTGMRVARLIKDLGDRDFVTRRGALRTAGQAGHRRPPNNSSALKRPIRKFACAPSNCSPSSSSTNYGPPAASRCTSTPSRRRRSSWSWPGSRAITSTSATLMAHSPRTSLRSTSTGRATGKRWTTCAAAPATGCDRTTTCTRRASSSAPARLANIPGPTRGRSAPDHQRQAALRRGVELRRAKVRTDAQLSLQPAIQLGGPLPHRGLRYAARTGRSRHRQPRRDLGRAAVGQRLERHFHRAAASDRQPEAEPDSCFGPNAQDVYDHAGG